MVERVHGRHSKRFNLCGAKIAAIPVINIFGVCSSKQLQIVSACQTYPIIQVRVCALCLTEVRFHDKHTRI